MSKQIVVIEGAEPNPGSQLPSLIQVIINDPLRGLELAHELLKASRHALLTGNNDHAEIRMLLSGKAEITD